MARFLKDRSKTKGSIPGSLIFIGDKKIEQPLIRSIEYNSEVLKENKLKSINEIKELFASPLNTWINIDGLHDAELFSELSNQFDISSLVMEDIMNTEQRPKIEDQSDSILLVLKMLSYNESTGSVSSEQISFLIYEKYLITFQEREGDVFNEVRERIRKSKGRIRKLGTDYLAYALLDTIVDNYLIIISRIGDRIEDLEDKVADSPTQNVLDEIVSLKKELLFLRKAIKPSIEAMNFITRIDSNIFTKKTKAFLKDLQELCLHANDAVDTYREMLSDHLNIYNISVNNKLNDIMKVLTIFSATFIPLTFLAGIYGTNFEYLPELSFKYSYFVFWAILIIVAFIMLFYFRGKGWIGDRDNL